MNNENKLLSNAPKWLLAVFPLVLLALLIVAFLTLNPLSFFTGAFPPLENLTIQAVTFPAEGEIELNIINGGPDPVTIAQVLVDDAYWNFTISDNTLDRLETATINIPYMWVVDEPLVIRLLTSTGATFDAEVDIAIITPAPTGATFLAYALLGIYVGVFPVILGMLWFPFMRQLDRKWMNAVLALTIGLLIFLFVDTLLEALEIAEEIPSVFQGVPIVYLGAFVTLLILLTIGQQGNKENSPLGVATLIAIGIGLHNFGEGLAIGAAFATGAAALGSFLVVGFTLHNITEGVGIAAPLLRGEQPSLKTFFLLALLAGAPAILGTWLGGLAFSPFWATLFLSIGAGAILQVIWEVGKLLMDAAKRVEQSAFTWLNFSGVFVGVLIMYLTAFLVKY
ncbi:MAG: ZIP family zinc transporter [Candidatus Promineifilaceae bacterium]|jgi:ZIP family zinc transporter